MTASPALLLAAAGVAFGHAVLPDHWAPLAVVGRTRRYPLAKVVRPSRLAGVAHVLVSLMLGAVIVAIGLQVQSRVQGAQDAIVGGLLIATGVGFAVLELTRHGHSHPHSGHDHDHGHNHAHEHEHEHEHDLDLDLDLDPEDPKPGRCVLAVMVPFGAAAGSTAGATRSRPWC